MSNPVLPVVYLDLGSGASPWSGANVLLDRFYTDPTGERSGAPIYKDSRPLIIAAGEMLPFKEKSIEYIFTRHVVEHADDVPAFLAEIRRVGKAGYLECPNPTLERVLDQEQHRWYLALENNRLHVCRKHKANNLTTDYDKFLFELLSNHYLIRNYWDLFTVQLHWKDDFEFELHEEFDNLLKLPISLEELGSRIEANRFRVMLKALRDIVSRKMVDGLRKYFGVPGISHLHSFYRWLRLGRKPGAINKHLSIDDLLPILCCPHDRGELRMENEAMVCQMCHREYPLFPGGVNFCPEDGGL